MSAYQLGGIRHPGSLKVFLFGGLLGTVEKKDRAECVTVAGSNIDRVGTQGLTGHPGEVGERALFQVRSLSRWIRQHWRVTPNPAEA